MKKAPLLITTGIVLLVVAGYFLYEKVLKNPPVRPWDIVPADAIVVYEKNDCHSCMESLKESSLGKIIDRIGLYKKPVDSIQNKINTFTQGRSGYLISAHITKKDEFDFVYYVPSSDDMLRALELFKSGKSYRYTSREFNSVQIQETRFSNQVFSYAFIENVWIGSFTPFLIEDVIRTYKSNSNSFKQRALSQQGFSSIQDDAGNLHIQLGKISELLSAFVAQPVLNYSLGKSALLDIKTIENGVVLNGFSMDSVDHTNYMLSIFQHQSPVTFGSKQLIPNRVLAVTSYGISDGDKFSDDIQSFVSKRSPQMRDTLVRLSASNNFDLESLYATISDELSVCFFESSKRKPTSRILLLETKNPEKWISTLNKVAVKLSIDTIFYERYAQYEIREIPVYRFPEKLFWPLVTGFDQSFYTSINNTLIISDNLEELKSFLDDIEAEDTWGKSVAQNRFLESTLLESNISLYINPSRAWNFISQQLQPRWQHFVRDNNSLLQSLQMSAIQFSHLNNSYYTNALFTYKPFTAANNSSATPTNKIVTRFDRGIMNIQAVRSHVNRNNEILLQDSLNDLSLISSEGKVLWKLPIGDRIISDVIQIDFYNNGKLQYLFSTSSAIHIIDRLGNYVDPYPIHLASVQIEYLSLIDYDNSKKYRIMVAEKNGRLWMYDKEGRSLEGWQPKDIGGSPAMPPRHYRIKGKDYLLAVRTDGKVYLMSRKGEDLRKFPLDSESIPSGDAYLEIGSTLANTNFVIASRDGFRIKFNTEGKIQSREALPKTSVSSVFSLINEKSNKSYLLLQQDGKQLSLTDESGKKIITTSLSGLKPSDIKFFDFGSGKRFIVISDKQQGFSYVYDGDGTLLTTPPLESTLVEVRPINSDQFRLFFVQDKSLVIQPL